MEVSKGPKYQVAPDCVLFTAIVHFPVAGFGLGALNDADEDDIDIYDTNPNATKNRLAYDAKHHDDTFTLGERSNSLKSEKVLFVHTRVYSPLLM